MEITLAGQTWCFLWSAAVGAALGALYDVLRILRIAVRHAPGVLFVQDVLFGIVASCVTLLFLLGTQYGEIRLFLLFGEGLGFVLYYFTLGALVLRAAKTILAGVRWCLRLIYRIFIAPVICVFRWILRFGQKIGRFFALKAKNILKISNTHLQSYGRVLYNQSKHLRGKRREKT